MGITTPYKDQIIYVGPPSKKGRTDKETQICSPENIHSPDICYVNLADRARGFPSI
jgi:hypothetical protein